jgi:hypothetical protein
LVTHIEGGTSAEGKNRVLRRIFEPKRDEVTGEWRKLHNEEINDLLIQSFSGDKIKEEGDGRGM